jgi:hypothetical protein
MRDRFTIGLVLVGLAILGYAIFSPRADDLAESGKTSSAKFETDPDAILPAILQKLDDQIRTKDGLIVVMPAPGLETFLLPASSPWLVRCATGASISLGHVWTTPALQEELTFGLRSGASHVSGLFARHHDRWP